MNITFACLHYWQHSSILSIYCHWNIEFVRLMNGGCYLNKKPYPVIESFEITQIFGLLQFVLIVLTLDFELLVRENSS